MTGAAPIVEFMKRTGDSLEFSATDLAGYLNCRHLSTLERAAAEGGPSRPVVRNPFLDALRERGLLHERNYVEQLEHAGEAVVRIESALDKAVPETLEAMKRGVDAIVQGALSHAGWTGRPDVLRRVDAPSDLGDWSYEAVDTKLARDTRADAIVQLCLYSDLLEQAQGAAPECMHIVLPWSGPRRYRVAEYAAYFRMAKRGFLEAMAKREKTYPDPVEHCGVCRWLKSCDRRRRKDDHLCLVAGISKLQMNELGQRGVATTKRLAEEPLPLRWKPDRGSGDSYVRVREQARLQVETRETGEIKFELLPVEPGFGLACLPEPSAGDVFLDLEGDLFVGEHGLEYLFGCLFAGESDEYRDVWAFSREEEKLAFEKFVDFVMERRDAFPDLHIYHYAPYEPSALKRLMGRYATREEEIDQMLRAGVFVDLYQAVRRGVRASVESYSIKDLEPFYAFRRRAALADANAALATLQSSLELGLVPAITDEIRAAVRAYNEDDCRSAAGLRDWLEELRRQLVDRGVEVPRPDPGDGEPSEQATEWQLAVEELVEDLTAGISADPGERSEEQQALWTLANVVDWHRREEKAIWWEFFRLAGLSAEDLQEERVGLSGLTFIGDVASTGRTPTHRYKFPPQETELRGGEELRSLGGDRLGTVAAIDGRTVDIKKRRDSADTHPKAVFAHSHVDARVLKEALLRIGRHVALHGLRGGGPYRAARDLLLRKRPRAGGQPLRRSGESTLEAAVRLCERLSGGILPIQGPPGAGKTFTGARMICELVRRGRKVGITANSHKVIRNLIDASIEAADELGVDIHCCHKTSGPEETQHCLSFAATNDELIAALGSGTSVGGGTAWFWAREEAFETVDVLFVDEAAQMSLANVLAVSQAAKTVVLIGDPQQLDQPMQGSHPDGADVSALDHILAGERTISPERGLFLDETWRLHPDVCAYASELFYDGKLGSKPGPDRHVVRSAGPIFGSGLRYLPVEHDGNRNNSPEEAEAIGALVTQILKSGAAWIDRNGKRQEVTLEDILVIAPYNAQVFEIHKRLPQARIGTVDKFQGQEAPIAIYSTATSSHADAPRGMEFLYSLNRLNVATSRAKCVSVMVSSPRLFEAECRTPRQIQLANAFCRFLEMAERLTLAA